MFMDGPWFGQMKKIIAVFEHISLLTKETGLMFSLLFAHFHTFVYVLSIKSRADHCRMQNGKDNQKLQILNNLNNIM